jgi:hypothetical protein
VEELGETAEASAGPGVREIVEHYEQLIRDLDRSPVLDARAPDPSKRPRKTTR